MNVWLVLSVTLVPPNVRMRTMNMLIKNKLMSTDKCIKQKDVFIYTFYFLYSNMWYFRSR